MKQHGTLWILVLLAVLVMVLDCEVAQVREDSIGEQNPDEARPSERLAENISSLGDGQALRLGRPVGATLEACPFALYFPFLEFLTARA